MGAWSLSITGNDTAQDLLSEYQAAFYYNDIDTALKKIEEYVRREGFHESDCREWCDYIYSLADYMWRKGILTDHIRDMAVRMIDSGFGLEIYEESGIKVLNERKKILAQIRLKLTSEQPPKKKISVNLHTKPILSPGDVIAFQLKTTDKFYTGKCKVSQEAFLGYHDKYVVVRKITDHVSYSSSIEPNVKDIWPTFQLYDEIFDHVPKLGEINGLGYASVPKSKDGLFYCEGSMFYFKRRNYVILGKDLADIEKYDCAPLNASIYFGINKPWSNADESILNALSV